MSPSLTIPIVPFAKDGQVHPFLAVLDYCNHKENPVSSCPLKVHSVPADASWVLMVEVCYSSFALEDKHLAKRESDIMSLKHQP